MKLKEKPKAMLVISQLMLKARKLSPDLLCAILHYLPDDTTIIGFHDEDDGISEKVGIIIESNSFRENEDDLYPCIHIVWIPHPDGIEIKGLMMGHVLKEKYDNV